MSGPVLGAVLAGGASSRFGSDKAEALLGGRTLLDHATAMLAGHVDTVVIVGRGAVSDLPRSGLGPLGGIAGALDHGRRRGFASVVTIACDMVRLPEGLVEALLERAPAYCTDAPVLGHWPTSLTAMLLERLAAHDPSSLTCSGIYGSAEAESVTCAARWALGQTRGDEGKGSGRHLRTVALSVHSWAIDIGSVAVRSPAPIANVNTPADLAAL